MIRFFYFLFFFMISMQVFADDPNWPQRLKPSVPENVTLINAVNFKLTGYCVSGNGNVSITFGTLSFTGECRKGLGAYKHIDNVSSEVVTNPIRHCVIQTPFTQQCSITRSNFLAPSNINILTSRLLDIDEKNVNNYFVAGSCAPMGAPITVDIGSQVTIFSGVCSVNHDYIISGDVSAVLDSPSITVTVHISSGASTAQGSGVISKTSPAPEVSITSALNINAVNESSYSLQGGCSEEGQAVVLSIGGINPASPICTSGLWSLTGFDASGVTDGSPLITADHANIFGAVAVQASVTILNDTVAPVLTINSPVVISGLNEAAYSLSGTCSENNREVLITIGGLQASPPPVCSLGFWVLSGMDVSSLPIGIVNILVSQTDDLENTTQIATTVNKVSVIVTLNIPSGITVLNENSYSVSGGCSDNGELVVVSVGGLAPAIQPTCTSGSWLVSLNVSSLPEGAVGITADHSNSGGVSAPQVTGNVNKDTIFENCQEVADLGASTGNYELTRKTSGVYTAYCEILGSDGWERVIRTTGNNANFGQTTAAIVSSYAAVGAAGNAVFEGFMEQTNLTKFMLKQGGNYGEYTLASNTGVRSVLDLLLFCKDDVHSAQNDTIHDGVRVVGHTSEYSGQRTGGTAFAGFPYFFRLWSK